MDELPKEAEAGTGKESRTERGVNHYVGGAIHVFLSVLAVLLLVAAVIAAIDTAILLIAIAAEFGGSAALPTPERSGLSCDLRCRP